MDYPTKLALIASGSTVLSLIMRESIITSFGFGIGIAGIYSYIYPDIVKDTVVENIPEPEDHKVVAVSNGPTIILSQPTYDYSR